MESERDVQIIQWFTNGYYSVLEREDHTIQINDLRYASMDGTFDEPTDYVFRFELIEENGKLVARQSRERPEEDASMKEFAKLLLGVK